MHTGIVFQEFHVGLLRKWPRNKSWGGCPVWTLGMDSTGNSTKPDCLTSFRCLIDDCPLHYTFVWKTLLLRLWMHFSGWPLETHKVGLKPMYFLPGNLERTVCSYIPSLGTTKVNLRVCMYADFTIMVWPQKISFSHGSYMTYNPLQLKCTLSAIITIIVCEFLKEGQKLQSSVGPFWVFGQIQACHSSGLGQDPTSRSGPECDLRKAKVD